MAKGNHHYLACWPDETLLTDTIGHVAGRAGLATTPVPDTIRLRRRGGLTFAFNYGDAPWTAPFSSTPILGEQTVGAQQVSIWRQG